jgi:hypothetical protein
MSRKRFVSGGIAQLNICIHNVWAGPNSQREASAISPRLAGRLRSKKPQGLVFDRRCDRLNRRSTVAVAQLVRVPDCGSGCRGFKSHQPPFPPPPCDVRAPLVGAEVRRAGSSASVLDALDAIRTLGPQISHCCTHWRTALPPTRAAIDRDGEFRAHSSPP